MTRDDIWQAILDERGRQVAKWAAPHAWGVGDCSSPGVHPVVRSAVLSEEVGEVSRAVLDRDAVALRRELVQVAAVAVAWLEGLAG